MDYLHLKRMAINRVDHPEARNQAQERALFTFTADNPQPGAMQWKAHQTFADGTMRHWVGERGSKEPASVTTIVPKGGAPTAPAADPAHKHE